MTEYLWKKFQEHQQFPTISILFPISAPWLIIIPRNFTTNFYLISNRGSKFLSNNLVNRSLARSSLPSLIFDQILIIGLISEDQTCLENRGRGISSSCWSWPRERCSIEISPYTSLGIQVSKILIIFIYNIYLSLISRNSNPIEKDLMRIYISFLFSNFPLATQRIFVRFNILESNLYIYRERNRERERKADFVAN